LQNRKRNVDIREESTVEANKKITKEKIKMQRKW
jgi:hypothetical protein